MICWILVTRNRDGAVVSLYSKDFKLELLSQSNCVQYDFDYRGHVANYFEHTNAPLNYDTYDLATLMKEEITILQHWEAFDLRFSDDNRCCAKVLPITGQIANILAILSGGYVTFMALQVVSADNNNESYVTSLSIMGALLDSFALLIIYNFSDASKILSEVGARFDRLFYKYNSDSRSISYNKDEHQILRLFLSMLAIIFVFSNTIVASIKRYQEIVLLTDKFLEISKTFNKDQRDIINILVADLYTATMAYSGLAFQSSFAFKLVNNLQDKLQKRKGGIYFTDISEPFPREGEQDTTTESMRLVNSSI